MGWQWHQLDHMQIICTVLQTDNHASTSPPSFILYGDYFWFSFTLEDTGLLQSPTVVSRVQSADDTRRGCSAVWLQTVL